MNTKSNRITATAIAATLAVSSLGLATAPAHAAQSSPVQPRRWGNLLRSKHILRPAGINRHEPAQ